MTTEDISSVTPARWVGDARSGYLELLDQRMLPAEEVWVPVRTAEATADAIRDELAAKGIIIEDKRSPGSHAWKPRGLTSSSPSMLLIMKPQPGTSRPLPSPFDTVIATALPSMSVTDTWVVPRWAT